MEYRFNPGISLRIGETPHTDESLLALASSSLSCAEIVYAPYCDDPRWTQAFRQVLDESPVVVNSVHAPFSREVDISRLDGGQDFAVGEVSKAIVMAERLGAGIVVVHGSSEPIADDERSARLDQSITSLRLLGEQAETAGVRLALELLPRTCLGNTADELQTMLSDISPQQAGFCLDVNHPADATQLTSIVKQLDDRIITLHISDYDGIDEKHWMPFRGIIDWAGFANALVEIGYDRAFVYETKPENGDTMAEKLQIVQSNFEKILAVASEASQG